VLRAKESKLLSNHKEVQPSVLPVARPKINTVIWAKTVKKANWAGCSGFISRFLYIWVEKKG
jgi:hypothetical protein